MTAGQLDLGCPKRDTSNLAQRSQIGGRMGWCPQNCWASCRTRQGCTVGCGQGQGQAGASPAAPHPDTTRSTEAAWEGKILQGAQHPLPATQSLSPGRSRGCDLAQGRAGLCPVCPTKHVLGLASCPSPPAASCPPNTGLPVIFHPGCELCPNEMFSSVPLTGLGPVQVPLFIQTLSPLTVLLLKLPTSPAGWLLL